MDKVLYVAMTGARENMFAQQVHANNLANATTTGFKADLEQARSMRVIGEGIPSRVYAMSERPATNTESGSLIETGRPLDVAVQGNDWMAVEASDGSERYARGGELTLDVNGQLLMPNGTPVLGNGGAPIIIPPAEQITIANDGGITIRPLGSPADELVVIDQIKLVAAESGQLWKGEDGLMRTDDLAPLPASQNSQLRSGYIESSNVNAVAELTSMISLSRQFEMQVKIMKSADENAQTASRILQLS
ncbi:MAG: flagellar basal body rod protein FlgF [Oceanospirillaceae bacterium]|nr:flagellar basal body rod protein FlgF [Oceanospirillaceae bacterium]